ncbi:MAG: amidohydrolase [Bacteroidetes bacterium]|nr:MAG: amidohydrolase [Bacteroidota bacterium]TAG85881.1 MAG: amidohydrolase [Bacteroidota bacterium]
MNITLIQTHIYWQDVAANLAHFEEKIWQIKQKTDLIILPEMFTTGFSMDAKNLAEVPNLTTFKWLKQMATQTDACVMGSYMVKENDEYFNRLIAMLPDGTFYQYDKRHLFRMANEHQNYTFGTKKIIFEWKNWKICPQICYDLRFPVWSRNVDCEYDLLVYVANWPQARKQAWNVLLPARAVENWCYVAAVNRIGEDGKGLQYSGNSQIADFKGETIWHQDNGEAIFSYDLDKKELQEYRQKFPAYLDADIFELKIK